MAHQSTSLVLNDPLPSDDMREWLMRLFGYQVEPAIGIFFHFERTFERGFGVTVHSFWSPFHVEVDIRLVCDHIVGTYVTVSAPEADMVNLIVEELARHLRIVSMPELIEDARRDGDVRAFLRLGLGVRGAMSEEAAEIIRDGLTSNDAVRRKAATMAAGLGDWPELIAPLRAALALETMEEVQRVIRFALDVRASEHAVPEVRP